MRNAFSTLTLAAVATLAGALLLAGPASAAGQVEVKYTESARFSDIGFASHERERNLASLTESFQRLGAGLPDGQTLKIDVLDVDLAGEIEPGTARDLRIVRGNVDSPRIKLRYTLQAGSSALKSGEAQLTDLGYAYPQRAVTHRDGDLPYEQRMITRWFNETFSANLR